MMDSDVVAGIVIGVGFLLTGAAALYTIQWARNYSHKRRLVYRRTGRYPRKVHGKW